MTVEEKVKKPHMIRLAVWAVLVLIISAIAICYHAFTDTHFAPAASAACVIFIAAFAFYLLGLWNYFTDKSFSGKIVHYKAFLRARWSCRHRIQRSFQRTALFPFVARMR